jgi:guanylate kinase
LWIHTHFGPAGYPNPGATVLNAFAPGNRCQGNVRDNIAAMPRGELFIVSAPSGAGKTTLIGRLMARQDTLGRLEFSVSHTTRAPRQGEIDGREYHFKTRPAFESMVASNRFLEWAVVHGNLYGTSLDEVDPRLERGVDVVLDIDVQGAEQVLALRPEAQSVFILPPSFADLENRLRGRALDGAADISRRLDVSLSEIKRYTAYRYVIINRDAALASEALAAIILEKRCRRDRMEDRVAEVVADFERVRRRQGEPAADAALDRS